MCIARFEQLEIPRGGKFVCFHRNQFPQIEAIANSCGYNDDSQSWYDAFIGLEELIERIGHMYVGKRFALGSGARSNFIKPGDNPGPGAYNPTLSKLPKGKSIRNGLRPNIVSGNNNPGPGEYKSSNIEIGDGLKLSMQGRKLDAKFNDNPGPGQYNPSINYVRSDPVSVNIGTGLRNSELRSQRNRVPGPGEYNSVKRDNAPTWSFPRDPRSKIVEDDEPGPGYYDIVPSIPDVPKYLMLHINKMDRID